MVLGRLKILRRIRKVLGEVDKGGGKLEIEIYIGGELVIGACAIFESVCNSQSIKAFEVFIM